MAELGMKNLVINFGENSYRIIGSRLEDICKELGITEYRFVELLSRDFYCPTLSAAPTSSTLTYIDTDGSENHFALGQPCRWQEDGGWRLALLKDNAGDVATWYVLPEEFVTQDMLDDKQDKSIKFTNLSANTWVSDSTYPDFPWRCDVTCEGVTGDMYADVVFNLAQSMSGNYAPLCETSTDVVSIWSNENISITIPTILITR